MVDLAALSLAEFPRNALEGYERPNGELDESVNNLHNLVHSMLNGTSALSHSAANDPIFVVSHHEEGAVVQWCSGSMFTLFSSGDQNAEPLWFL